MSLKTIRHKKNPFLEKMNIKLGKKNVYISSPSDKVLVDRVTGEAESTHIVSKKTVDRSKFVKTFSDYMSFTFDLTKAGNKALRCLMWAVSEHALGKDIVALDKFTHAAFIEFYDSPERRVIMSYTTFARGLAELEKAKLIAKTERVGFYYINPSVIFNGSDRRKIAFTTVLDVDDEGDSHKQQDLLNSN